ncbi:GNAT family N-acetyltransferase [Lentibacillus salicampi]|nr:GNAT family N-acetyltransferase [Lentibacillus salicampi]
MENSPIYMLHDLKHIPDCPLPDGFHFSLLHHKEEGKQWANLVTETGEFPDESQALARFGSELASDLNEAKKRVIFLKTTDGRYAGTASAWFGKWDDETIGRLHWVEIAPAFQGIKLGRPLIIKALKQLKMYHEKAYLKTQPASLAAIHLYLNFGFKPAIHTADEKCAWNHVFTQLHRK